MPNYNILALDAACGQAAAVVLDREQCCLGAECQRDRPHSMTILPLLQSVLETAGLTWVDLNLLALGIGPGSFTGLRISASILAGINSRLGLPMLSVSSLAITALQAQSRQPVWILEDARAGDAYVGHFVKGRALRKDRILPWSEVRKMPPGIFASQTKSPVELPGWQRLPLEASRFQALGEAVRATMESVNLPDLPQFIHPSYLSRSQAERNLKSKPGKIEPRKAQRFAG